MYERLNVVRRITDGRGVGKQITNLGILIRFGGEVFDTENPKTIVGKPGTRVPTPLQEPPDRPDGDSSLNWPNLC